MIWSRIDRPRASKSASPRAPAAGPAPRPRVDIWSEEFDRASLHHRVLAEAQAGAGAEVMWSELAEAAWRSTSWPAARRRALVHWFVVDWARLRGLACPEDFARSFEARWRASNQVTDVRAWANARGLTSCEHAALLARSALIAWLEDSGPAALGIDWDGEASSRVEALLSRATQAPLPFGSSSAFLAAWARESGARCPRTERDQRWARWSVASAAARRDVARRLGIPPRSLRRVLEDHATAEWLLAVGPQGFGRVDDVDIAAVKELQFTSAIAMPLCRRRAS